MQYSNSYIYSQCEDVQALDNKKILIIEDDRDIAACIKLHFDDIYDTVAIENNSLSGYQLATSEPWDIIILDIRLPGKDGLDICRHLRSHKNYVPILMLTSKSSELDRVLGLEMGADDYLTKPFSIIELAARVKAIFRRMESQAMKSHAMESHVTDHATTEKIKASAHNIELNTRLHTLLKNDKNIELTVKEFDLLNYFLQNPGCVFSRSQLLKEIWGYGHEGYEHTVNSHINRLRAKIEDNPTQPKIIITVWGVGYKLSDTN